MCVEHLTGSSIKGFRHITLDPLRISIVFLVTGQSHRAGGVQS